MLRLMTACALAGLLHSTDALAQASQRPPICLAPGALMTEAEEAQLDEAAEATCVAAANGIASREPCQLTLSLFNGATKVIPEQSPACGLPTEREDETAIPRFLAYVPAMRTYVVADLFYESQWTSFVSADTGQEQKVGPGVHLSPDGTTIVEINDLDGAGSGDYSVGVWIFDGSQIRRVLRHGPDTGYESWNFVRWNGPGDVAARVSKHVPEPAGPMKEFTARVFRDKAGVWKLTVSKTPKA